MSLMSTTMLMPGILVAFFRWVQFGSTVLILVLGSLYLACAQPESNAARNSADAGKAAVERGVNVDLSSRPQTNAGEGASVLPPPRPRGGVSDEEYKARKENAAKRFPPGSSEPTETAPPPRPRGR
jgi:hypothetical protein